MNLKRKVWRKIKMGFSMNLEKIPEHVVIIPDGNRRWAKSEGKKSLEGYKIGGENLRELFREANKIGIKYLTLWIFSTDNWGRNKKEVKSLFDLFLKNLKSFKKELIENKIRFRHFGRKDRLPKKILHSLRELELETENFGEYNIQFCFDYGGRDEIIRAINKLLVEGKKEINEEEFERYLDSYDIPNPDLIIRTSGEKRLSGFMPFQSVYSELYFTDVHFPEFNSLELRKAIDEFAKRKRNFGR